MPVVGWHASHEQISPSQLLDDVQYAESAGFQAAWSSDHFAPWASWQGQSGFSYAWLGAAMARTSFPVGVVTAPGQRYHPAIVAQAIATLAQMFPDRLSAAFGSGELINEHITGDPWPAKPVRDARLRECVEVIRALLAGEEVTHDGLVRVDRARLWSLPARAPRLLTAAVTARTAAWAAEWSDGLITVWQPPDALGKVVDAFRAHGGDGKPLALQLHVSWAPTDEEALRIAYDQWRSNLLSPPLCWNLGSVEEFEQAATRVRPHDMHDVVLVSSDPGLFVKALTDAADLGFDEVYVHHVGQEQRRFVDLFGERVLPQVTS